MSIKHSLKSKNIRKKNNRRKYTNKRRLRKLKRLRGGDEEHLMDSFINLASNRSNHPITTSRNFPNSLIESNKQLTKFPNIFDNFDIKNIDLSHNHIEEIPEDIHSLINLKNLNLSHNKLKTLPDGIMKLEKLELLSLADNEIDDAELENIEYKIEKLSNLRTLNLQHNKNIKNFPERIGNLYMVDGMKGYYVLYQYLSDNQKTKMVENTNKNRNRSIMSRFWSKITNKKKQ